MKLSIAAQVIDNNEHPVAAIRRAKKIHPFVVAQKNGQKKGKADAVISAGSTGAILVGGQLVVGRIKGVERAPLAAIIPTTKGVSLLIDCGRQCGRKSFSSASVCQDGVHLYGKMLWGRKIRQ